MFALSLLLYVQHVVLDIHTVFIPVLISLLLQCYMSVQPSAEQAQY